VCLEGRLEALSNTFLKPEVERSLISFGKGVNMSKNNIFLVGLLAIALIGLSPMIAGVAHADTFTVTTAVDTDCSDFQCDFQSALTAAETTLAADVRAP
jgi:hypothetical protein